MDELTRLHKKIAELERNEHLYKETEKRLQTANKQLQLREQQLKSDQQTHNRTQKIAHVGSWEWDVATDIVSWSDELFRIFRLNPEDGAVSYADHPKIYTPESMQRLDTAVQHTLETAEPYEIDLEIIRGDGTNAFCTVRCLAKKDEKGNVIQLFGSFQDITERKNSEEQLKALNQQLQASEQQLMAANEQLQANEQQLRAANQQLEASEKELRSSKETAERYLNIAAKIILCLDSDGNVTLLNDSGYQLMGYEVGSLSGKNWITTCLPKEQQNYLRSVFEQLMKGEIEKLANYESTIITKSGEIKTILWHNTVLKDKNGKTTGTLSSGEDITEKVKTVQELAASESFLKAIFDKSINAILVADDEGNYITANEAAANLFGYPLDKLLKMNVNELIQTNNPNAEEKYKQYVKEGKETGEIEFTTPNGQKKIAHYNAIRIKKDFNLSVLDDITERIKSEAELKKIEWLLQPKKKKAEVNIPDYGDLTNINQDRTILDSVGKEVLNGIVSDYLSLLDTSAAVYEKNGDYAVGIFSSEWCQFMDCSSRALCKSKDNKKALESGKWLCHESCWADASNRSIQTKKAVDIECHGGLNIYAIPIKANKKVIGAINFGYGNPPTDEDKLIEIAGRYNVSLDKLKDLAQSYETRPAFIIDIAKEKLESSARLIGNIVERKQMEEELLKNQKRYQKAQEIGAVGNWEYDLMTEKFWGSDETGKIFGIKPDIKKIDVDRVENCIPERTRVYQALIDLIEHDKKYNLIYDIITEDKGIRKTINSIAEIERDAQGNPLKITGVVNDITIQKKTDDNLKALNQQLEASNQQLRANEQQLRAAVQQLQASEEQLKALNKELETGEKELIDANKKLRIAKEIAEESEEKFSTIFNMSLSMICVADINTATFKFINPAFKKVLGYDEKELLSKPFLDFIHPDDLKPTIDVIEKKLKAGHPQIFFENRYIRKDGQYCHLAWNSFPFPEKGIIYAIAHDITEQKHVENELIKAKEKVEESERKLIEAQELSHVGNWEYIIDADTVTWSKELYTIFERSYDLPAPQYSEQRQHYTEESFAVLDKAVEDCVQRDIPYEIELDIITSSGTIKQIISKGKSIKDNNNKIIGSYGTAQDITQKKKTEQELIAAKEKAEESEANVTAIIEGTTNSIWAFNRSYQILYINKVMQQEFLQTFGVLLEPGLSLVEVLPESLQSLWKPRYDRVLANEQFTVEDAIPTDNGIIYIQVSFNPIVKNGEVIGGSCIGSNITSRKLIELELIAAKEKAEESDRLKSAFLANMSHEIRTPMNGILGFTNLLQNPDLTGEEQGKYVDIIQKSGDRMLNMVNDIIDISRIESGLVERSVSKVNINEQLKDLHSFFSPEAAKKGIQLTFKIDASEQDFYINTDLEKFNSIVTNLIKNAIKFTNQGFIELGYQIVDENGSGKVEFYVKDSGIGIPRNRQEAIFHRFVQADIENKQAKQGSGLGLAISKAYAEMLGGKIWVDSEEGNGSTFYFTIENNSISKLESITINDGLILNEDEISRKLKILVVEDDQTSQYLISIVVKKFAKKIITVSSGLEAVEVCRNNADIDLILMDIQLPGINGYEATQQIRQFNKDVVIIAQTAFALSGDKEEAIKIGCNDYISKPLNQSELDEMVKEYFMN